MREQESEQRAAAREEPEVREHESEQRISFYRIRFPLSTLAHPISYRRKDLNGVVRRRRPYLLGSHVSTLAHHVYCMYISFYRIRFPLSTLAHPIYCMYISFYHMMYSRIICLYP